MNITLLYFTNCQGSTKIKEFLVPVMVDRWSKFAISVSDNTINLFVYCHNYTVSLLEESTKVHFEQDSLLVIGHAGSAIQQAFKVDINFTSTPNKLASNFIHLSYYIINTANLFTVLYNMSEHLITGGDTGATSY